MAVTVVHDCDVERRDAASPTTINGDFRDTYLAEDAKDTTHNGDGAKCGRESTGGKGGDNDFHGIFRYDLTKFLPADAVITAAVLWVYVAATSASTLHPFKVYRLATTGWPEDSATWNKYDGMNSWPTAGGDYTTPDVALGAITTTGWKSYDIKTIVDDAMLNRSGICNLLLRRTDTLSATGTVIIRTKEWHPSGPADIHHLRITYTLDGKTFQTTAR